MSCIPFNAYDKHKIKSRYFLSAFKIVKEPSCSDLEKTMVFIPALIGVLSNLVLPILGSLVAGYASDSINKNISIDKLKKGVQLNKNTDLRNFWDKQDPDFKKHAIIWGLHDAFITKNTHDGNIEEKFDKGQLSKEQLNFMFWIKQFIDPIKVELGLPPHIIKSEMDGYVTRVIKGHRKNAGYVSFKRQAWGIINFINSVNVTQYDPNANNNANKTTGTMTTEKFKKMSASPFALVSAGLGLYFTLKN